MPALAMPKALRLRRSGPIRRRPAGRVAIAAWAIAAIAVAGAGASLLRAQHGAPAAIVALADIPEALAGEAPDAKAVLDPARYRKPAPAPDGRPRVAIILRGLAMSERLTARAIQDLPPEITLAFSPYGRELQKSVDSARDAGHEIFLDLPVEPTGYPANDAGPQALLTSLTPGENLDRLSWSMARFSGYAGIALPLASPALESAATVAPVLEAAATHGLVWAHPPVRSFDGARIDGVRIAVSIDDIAGADAVNAQLERLEAKARAGGAALAIAAPYPVTIDMLKRWAARLDSRGFVLVPASALAAPPPS